MQRWLLLLFIHLHIVKVGGTRKVTKITKRRKMFFLLNKCLNIQIFSEIWYLRRWSRICEKFREAFVREWKITKKLQIIMKKRRNISRVSMIKSIVSWKQIVKIEKKFWSDCFWKLNCSREASEKQFVSSNYFF